MNIRRSLRVGTSSRPVEDRVYVLSGIIAALSLSLLILITSAVVTPARADAAEAWPGSTFEYGGSVYPSSLSGVVVTFNTNPGAPDSYMGRSTDVPFIWNGGWRDVGGWSVLEYTGNEVTSRIPCDYIIFEKSTVPNPWFIGWNVTGNSNPARGMQYFNGGSNVRAWYAHSITQTRTFQFSGTLGSLSGVDYLLLHHDVIRYVVDNSDFRSRYSLPTTESELDVTTSFSDTTITVSWTGNPDIFIQRRSGTDSWETVQYVPAPSPYSYTVTSSGTYRVYATQSGYQDYTSGGHSFTVSGISYLSGSISMSSDYSTLSVQASFAAPLPEYVYVQVAEDNPLSDDYGQWRTLLPVLTANSEGSYSYTYPWSEADRYSKVRLMVEANGQTLYFDLGKTDNWTDTGNDEFDFPGAISNVVQWVHQFTSSFGDLFAWLPAELRVMLISVFMVMIILGLFGWLKK